MASIIKRKKKYSVVYFYYDEHGDKKQKWETFGSHKEALRRRSEVEFQQPRLHHLIPYAICSTTSFFCMGKATGHYPLTHRAKP
jgi:hypothetical protein